MNSFSEPKIIEKKDLTKDFDCGNFKLNDYLKKYAFQNQKKNISKTFITKKNNKIVGYYTLVFSSIQKKKLDLKTSKNLPNYPIPAILIARLAVDISQQNNGLGKGLLKDAMLRAIRASSIAGLKVILVQAKDDKSKSFYQKFDFIVSPIDNLILYLPIEYLLN